SRTGSPSLSDTIASTSTYATSTANVTGGAPGDGEAEGGGGVCAPTQLPAMKRAAESDASVPPASRMADPTSGVDVGLTCCDPRRWHRCGCWAVPSPARTERPRNGCKLNGDHGDDGSNRAESPGDAGKARHSRYADPRGAPAAEAR